MNETATGAATAERAWPSNFTERIAALAQTRRSQLQLVLAVFLYMGCACQLTWPLVIHLAHTVYAVPGDPFGTMALYRELVDHHQNPFLPGALHQFGAPEGMPIPWPTNLASAPGVLSLYIPTALFGAAPALSLYTLGGYVLTGTVTFLFVRRLTANAWAATIAGWAYAFYPFAIINGLGHVDNVQGWVLVLAVWRLIELQWRPSRRNGLLAGLALVLAMWWSPYFILLTGVMYVIITALTLILAWRGHSLRATLAPQLIAASILVVFMAFLGLLAYLGSAEGLGARTHGLGDLYTYAARPLAYVIPDVLSPLFGRYTKHYFASDPYSGGMEETIYVGVTILLLSLLAFAYLVRRKLSRRLSTTVLALWLIAIAAVITSMQPEMRIFGIQVPFPSHFILLLTSTWRVYSRFVMVVMLALSALAAIGLDQLTRGRGTRTKIVIMSIATIVIPLDLWARQPGSVVKKISTPGIYETLARQPMGLVAEYPLAPGGGNHYDDLFYHNIHNKPMINGYGEGSLQELRAFSLYDLSNPLTAPRLATLGVRYVLVDATPPDWGWPESGPPGAGFRLIAHEPYADLYVVTAHPSSSAIASEGVGFQAALPTPAGSVTWLEQPSGSIEITGACTPCSGVISMAIESRITAHQVTIRDSKGHVLAQGNVPLEKPVQVAFPLQFSKRTTLTMTTTPGPKPISHRRDAAIVSVLVADLEFNSIRATGNPAAQVPRKR